MDSQAHRDARRSVRLFAIAFLAPILLISPQLASAAVGRTPGTFDVSQTGAATYTISLWAPPGPKGIQPNLALVYNSRSGDGDIGVGWQLAGLSAIARCPKTVRHNGAAVGVALTTSDQYCLGGNPLRATNGTVYGAASSIYETELANFSLVQASSTLAGNGPASFTVKGKDGLIYEYGTTADSRLIPCPAITTGCPRANTTAMEWRLSKVRDRAGNNYVIAYGPGATGSSGVAVPLTISYTPASAGAITYKYAVTLNYATRLSQVPTTKTPSLTGYVAGLNYTDTNLLTSIAVASGSTTVRLYSLAYGSGTTLRPRLTSVTECADAAKTNCFAPTNIAYQDGVMGVGNANATSFSTSLSVVAAADLNGDQRDDIVLKDGTGAVYVSLANSSTPGL
jgi:hypothetical protein